MISKYWVMWALFASALSKVETMLTPSMGDCTTPLTLLGSGNVAGFKHGGRYINDMVPLRTHLIGGQETIRPLRVPP